MIQEGTWLHAKPNDYYGKIKIVEFEKNQLNIYHLEQDVNVECKKIKAPFDEFFELTIENVNPERLRFLTKGKKTSVFGNGNSVTVNNYFQNDYVKLIATKTALSFSEIEKCKYEITWNNHKTKIAFNQELNPEYLVEINKRLSRSGRIIRLGKLEETLMLLFYDDNDIELILPIEEITSNEIILYGFEKEPFKVTGKSLDNET